MYLKMYFTASRQCTDSTFMWQRYLWRRTGLYGTTHSLVTRLRPLVSMTRPPCAGERLLYRGYCSSSWTVAS